jgi:hypothetical protein
MNFSAFLSDWAENGSVVCLPNRYLFPPDFCIFRSISLASPCPESAREKRRKFPEGHGFHLIFSAGGDPRTPEKIIRTGGEKSAEFFV